MPRKKSEGSFNKQMLLYLYCPVDLFDVPVQHKCCRARSFDDRSKQCPHPVHNKRSIGGFEFCEKHYRLIQRELEMFFNL